jgi:hypothetical protein
MSGLPFVGGKATKSSCGLSGSVNTPKCGGLWGKRRISIATTEIATIRKATGLVAPRTISSLWRATSKSIQHQEPRTVFS